MCRLVFLFISALFSHACMAQVMCNAYAKQRASYSDVVFKFKSEKTKYYEDVKKESAKAIELLTACLKYHKKEMTEGEYYNCLYQMGAYLMNIGKYENARSFFDHCIVSKDKTNSITIYGSDRLLYVSALERKLDCDNFLRNKEQNLNFSERIEFFAKEGYLKSYLNEFVFRAEKKYSLDKRPYNSIELTLFSDRRYPVSSSRPQLDSLRTQFGFPVEVFNREWHWDQYEFYLPMKTRWASVVESMDSLIRQRRKENTDSSVLYDMLFDKDYFNYIFQQSIEVLNDTAFLLPSFKPPFLIIPSPAFLQGNPKIDYYPSASVRSHFSPLKSQIGGFFKTVDSIYNVRLCGSAYRNTQRLWSEIRQYQQILDEFHSFFKDEFMVSKPIEHIVPVLLAGGDLTDKGYKQFSSYADSIHFRPAYGRTGYFNAPDNSIMFWAASGTGTLQHEEAHVIMRTDFPAIPYWLNEGIASLFEQSSNYHIEGHQRIEPKPNWRGTWIKKFKEKFNRHISVYEIIESRDYSQKSVRTIYNAYARYFCYFLYQNGILGPIYRGLRDDTASMQSADRQLQLIERIAQKDRDILQRNWQAWLDSGHVLVQKRKVDDEDYEGIKEAKEDTIRAGNVLDSVSIENPRVKARDDQDDDEDDTDEVVTSNKNSDGYGKDRPFNSSVDQDTEKDSKQDEPKEKRRKLKVGKRSLREMEKSRIELVIGKYIKKIKRYPFRETRL